MKTTWCTNGICVCLICICLSSPTWALIEVYKGNDPIRDPGLPTGAKAVADLPSRLGYMVGPPFGGEEYYFTYQCQDTAAFNRTLDLFSQIRVPRVTRQWLISLNGQRTALTAPPLLLLVVHNQSDRIDEERLDWTFTIWCPENHYRLFCNPRGTFDASHPNYQQPVPPPRIDVYLGGDCPIAWDKVKVPANLKVIDARTGASGQGGTVTGAVYDMNTHRVIPQAQIKIVKTSRSDPPEVMAQAQASDQGSFALTGIKPGYYRVYVEAEDYVARDWAVFNNRSGHERLDADILLCHAASLKGQVVDQAGQPVADIKVTTREIMGQDGRGYACVNEPQADTNAQGQFVIEGLPEGYTHLRCRAPSLHQETSIFELYPVSRRLWSRDEDIKLVVTGTGIIQGKVLDTEGNVPTRQFLVELKPEGGERRGTWGYSGMLKSDGSFEIKGIPPGRYVLAAQPNPMRGNEATEPQVLDVQAGKTLQITLRTEHAHAGTR